MKTIYSNFAKRLVLVLAVVLMAGSVYGADPTKTTTFSEANLFSVDGWSKTSGPNTISWMNNCVQETWANLNSNSLVLSNSTDFAGKTIKGVSVNYYCNGKGSGSMTVKVGGSAFGTAQTLSGGSNSNHKDASVTGSATGAIEITFGNVTNTDKRLFIQSITVTYATSAPSTSVSANPTSITFDDGELEGDEASGSATITSISVTNGNKSSGNYLNIWAESDDDNCEFTVNGSVYASDNATSVNNLSVEYYAISAGTFTGNVIAQGYNSSYVAVNCTIPLSVTITAGCEKAVTIAKGTETNATLSLGATSVKTCSETAADRQVTVSVVPAACYEAPVKESVSATNASWVSGPTWNNTTSKYDYVYQLAKDATGTATFSVSIANKTTYTINYNQGTYGTGDNSSTSKTCGVDLTLPGVSFTRTGYTQAGWSTAQAGTSKAYDLSGSYTANNATTLYPYWSANTYSITYRDQNDEEFSGTQTSAPTQHTYGTATTLKSPTKVGYTFDGWFTVADCESGAVGNTLAANGYTDDITLYAKWTLKSCTVTFDKNGGDEGSNSETAEYGKALPTITPPTRLHYIFNGYYDSETNNNGSGTLYYNPDGTSAKNWDKDVTAGQTLYAKWTEHTYTNYRTICCTPWDDPTVAYSSYALSVGGTATVSIDGTTHGTVSYESSNTDVLTVDEDGTVTGVTAGVAHVTVSWTAADGYCEKAVNSADITVIGNVTVTFDANGGSSTMEPQSIPVSKATALTANGFTAPDCKQFAHWNTESDDSGETTYADEASVTITKGMTLYAIWEKIPYTITKGTNSGAETFELSPTSSVDCGGTITVTCAADDEHKGEPTITATEGKYDEITKIDDNTYQITGVSGDITVAISYTAKTVYNITWKVGGVALEDEDLEGVTTSVVEGNGLVTLPTVANSAVGTDLTFMGWTAGSELTGLGNSAPSDLFTAAGSEPTIEGPVTYHAVFATQTAEASDSWDLCETVDDVTAGDYVITWDNTYYLNSETESTNADPSPVGSGITVSGRALSNTVTAHMQWTFAGNNSDGFTIRHAKNNTTYYLGAVDAAKGIRVGTAEEGGIQYSWTVSIDATYGMLLKAGNISRYLAVNGTSDWRYYNTGNNYTGTLRLYKHNVTEAAYADYITKVVGLKSIAVTTAPEKTVYKKGEVLDLTNMVVTATYEDNSTNSVDGYTVAMAGTALSTDDDEFEVSYTEGDVTKTTTQAIHVYELSGIALSGTHKTTYKSGETVNTTNLVVTATWGDAEDKIVESDIEGYTIDLDGALSVSDTKYEVSYTHESVTKTAEQSISVYDLSGIAITNAPMTTTYTAGDNFDATGMVVTATWGDNKIVEEVNGYTISPATLSNDTESDASQNVTISYTSNGVTETATQTVTVHPLANLKMTWHVANEDAVTTKIYINAQDQYILALPDAPNPEAVGFSSDYVFKGWTTASSIKKNGTTDGTTAISYVSEGTEMSLATDFYAVFAVESQNESTIFTETFNNCAGTGGNDGYWTGTGNNDIYADNSGWTFSRGNGASECAKFGTGNYGGSAQTPSLTLNGATATITFKAGAWNATGEGTSLSVATSEGTLKSGSTTVSSVTIKKGEWDNFTLTLTGVTNSAKITFSTASGNKRFFLDEVVVSTSVTTYSNYRLKPSAVKTPTISLAENTYYGEQTVTISQEDSKPIYYTLDGTTPTDESTPYTNAINLNEACTKTLKAVAYDADVDDYSQEASATYTIVTEIAAPTLTAGGNFYTDDKEVEISHDLMAEGAVIYYSYDDASYTTYTEALTITETKTVYAYATIGSLTSEKASATYTKAETVTYKKITTDAELAMGMQFIIAATMSSTEVDAGAGLRSGTNSYLNKVDVPEPNAQSEIAITNQAVSVFTLDGMPGAYTMTSQQGKLSCGGNTNVNFGGAYDKWTIVFADGVPAIKSTNGSYSSYELKYNTAAPRFTMYSNQTAVALYVAPHTAYTLTYDIDGTDKAFKVVEGYEYTITNTTCGTAPANCTFLNKWTDGTHVYAIGDKITLTEDVTLIPCWKQTIPAVQPGDAATINSNTLPTSVTEIVVGDNMTFNVTSDKTYDNLIVEAGGHVSVAEDLTLTVNDFTIESAAGKSGQLIQGEDAEIQVTGVIYMDVKFYSSQNGTTLNETEASQWYMISAPFDVNLADGFINPVSGVTMHMGNDDEVNTFDLFEYDGEKRATTGTTGWKRVNGKMTAGTACLIGFNPGQPTTIRLKAASNEINNPTSITLAGNTSTVGETDQEKSSNSDWNGVANPTFHYTDLDKDAYIWNNEEGENGRKYNVYSAGSCTFVVGTPLFIQGNTSANLTAATNTQFRAPKRNTDERIEYCVRITRKGANDFADQMYVRASEEASATYERGHDLIAWNGTSGKSALLWSENYGMRLAIEEAPLANNGATYVLGLYAPADGVYTISTPTEDEDATLYLTLNGHIIWNLSQGAYTAELQQGQNSGYGLKIVAAPKVSTDVEQSVVSDQPSVQKVIIDEHVFILRGGQMYDVNGKMVK